MGVIDVVCAVHKWLRDRILSGGRFGRAGRIQKKTRPRHFRPRTLLDLPTVWRRESKKKSWLSLPFLVLVESADSDIRGVVRKTCCRRGSREQRGGRCCGFIFEDGNSHVSPVPAFAAIAFILADALIRRDAGIFASRARPLSVATLLALPAPLTSRLRR